MLIFIDSDVVPAVDDVMMTTAIRRSQVREDNAVLGALPSASAART